MNKKLIKIFTVISLISYISSPVLANDILIQDNSEIVSDTENKDNKYIYKIGTIKDINENSGILSILVEQDGEKIIFKLNKNTLVLDLKTMDKVNIKNLKIGDSVEGFYGSNNIIIQSLPRQVSPDVLIINNEDSISAKVDYFDENNLSSDKKMKIDNKKQENIFTLENDEIKKSKITDISNKNLVIFYDIGNKENLEQITPKKVIILNGKNPQITDTMKDNSLNSKSNLKIEDKSIIIKDNKKYISLLDLSKKVNYNLSWNEEKRKVTMTKNKISYVFTIGKLEYELNNKILNFTNTAPIILNDRAYVEYNFIDKVLN